MREDLIERLNEARRKLYGDGDEHDVCDTLAEAAAALAAMGGQGEARESRMVVLRRKQDGTPSVWCDPEIADLVAALNAGGVPTIASCSGHGERPGNIALADGRELLVAKDYAEARAIESASVANPAPRQPEARVGGEVSYAECCDTPAYCSSVRRCTAKDTPPPSAMPEGCAIDQASIEALVAGPFMHHHKMNELQEREAKGFDRCRELTLQNIAVFFATRSAMLAAAPEPREG